MHYADSLLDELIKIAEASKRQKPLDEKVIEVGAPMLVGSGVGKTLVELSLKGSGSVSPRKKTLGVIGGALTGLGYHAHKKTVDERKKTFKKNNTPKGI